MFALGLVTYVLWGAFFLVGIRTDQFLWIVRRRQGQPVGWAGGVMKVLAPLIAAGMAMLMIASRR